MADQGGAHEQHVKSGQQSHNGSDAKSASSASKGGVGGKASPASKPAGKGK